MLKKDVRLREAEMHWTLKVGVLVWFGSVCHPPALVMDLPHHTNSFWCFLPNANLL
jgi:hypothetical protein